MIDNPLTEDALRTALQRVADFASVHDGKGDYDNAMTVLRESLGLDREALVVFVEESEHILNREDIDGTFLGGALYGLIVGLIAADYASEA